MLKREHDRMSVAAFFAWQERQAERYELVDGVPVRLMAGTRNVHDDVVVNLVAALHTALRGSGRRLFTRDFNAFEKLAEYKALASLDHILMVEPNAAEIMPWSRDASRVWRLERVAGLDARLQLRAFDVTLALSDVYDGVKFPARPRLVPDEASGESAA